VIVQKLVRDKLTQFKGGLEIGFARDNKYSISSVPKMKDLFIVFLKRKQIKVGILIMKIHSYRYLTRRRQYPIPNTGSSGIAQIKSFHEKF